MSQVETSLFYSRISIAGVLVGGAVAGVAWAWSAGEYAALAPLALLANAGVVALTVALHGKALALPQQDRVATADAQALPQPAWHWGVLVPLVPLAAVLLYVFSGDAVERYPVLQRIVKTSGLVSDQHASAINAAGSICIVLAQLVATLTFAKRIFDGGRRITSIARRRARQILEQPSSELGSDGRK